MTLYFARTDDNVVVEVISIGDDQSVAELYHSDIANAFISCGATVQQGYFYDGKKFSPPAVPEITTADLIAYAAARRFAIETGGITVDGSKVASDRQSQALITGAYNFVQANPSETVHFKTSGGFVELTATQMTAIANAVGAHVQAAFAAESSVVAAIGSGSISTIAEIDAASWPSN